MSSNTPTVSPPKPESLSESLRRNIEALEGRRKREAASASTQQKVAQKITAFAGSMVFVYVHLVLYGLWISVNVGLIPKVPRFDPSLVTLAMIASVEAIFLSTFVLISQNRMAAAADRRADLDLQINLLAEHELTKLAELVEMIAKHLQVPVSGHDAEINEIKKDVAPEAVLDEIEAHQKETAE
ncbi:Uncharacterized membrane protein [Faunimonas pinastri]|uniref:Uncharacterized membrane protein n=1 Tax=Faunimonas pinastri TaxID=1855383 RepID=A0A1H9FLG0_9HYPH|nr:DUF1003 domain-containing protein [Faunimonas pinastri]SEQ38752.1 Uncharacterized membrane protein [Faunimonas pinastri]